MWRVSTCWRGPSAIRSQMVTELSDARARKFHADLNGPATAEIVIDGRSPQCAGIQELSQDLVLNRFNRRTNFYECWFRGPIGRSEDTISETVHTVNVAASDYRAMLGRRIMNGPTNYMQQDQALIFQGFVGNLLSSSFGPFTLGLLWRGVYNPDGTYLGATTGVLRDRSYTGAEKTLDMLDNLSQVINGFDWGIEPYDPTNTADPLPYPSGSLYLWYPQRGIVRSFVAEYGATVSNLTRTVNSTDFANWVRNDGQNNADGTPMFANSLGDAVTNPQLHPEGVWQEGISHSDVNQQATLQQQADGELARTSILQPSYTLSLVPGAWLTKSDCWLGDSIELRVVSGRLAVDTTIRILQVDIDIDDNGVERVALTVGRPAVSLSTVIGDQQARLDALSRR
jgi:hypothetical protein